MSKSWMIYGAYGYTGKLAAEEAKRRGMTPILAGRGREEIEELGKRLGFEARVFGLESVDEIARNLAGVAAVLNCAGPFSATSKPMLAGCVRAKCHYLDITGEIAVFEDVHSRTDEFKRAGIVAMPGVGFDVVPSDCLAAMLKRELPGAVRLKLAFKSHRGKLSPGTTKTMIEGMPEGGKIRKDGKIIRVPAAYKVEEIPFADKPELAMTIPWGDVSTAYHSTGIPNIEVFIGTNPKQLSQMKMMGWFGWLTGIGFVQSFMKNQVKKKVKGPSESERANDEMLLYGEAEDAAGKKIVMRMRTPEGYTFTVDSSLAAVAKLLEGNLAPGAYTPSMAFGPDFVLGLQGVRVSDPSRA
ncbi:saccharopine dehydrogenase NADP-binding domain-containing protein [Candidatus Sumerlaeota bacterium]|nr:saccharopine dehydrogenase NADP-binding domain-containing protein [Candidatus Sumerlaeota bacterium]